MKNKVRKDFLDYAKALTVFMVVFVHVGFYQLNEVFLFAMPLFFVVTGYNYTMGKRTFWKSVNLRFRKILIPFWLYMILYTVVEMVRAVQLGYGTWKVAIPSIANAIYGSGVIPMESQFMRSIKEIMSYKEQVEIGADVILPSNCHLWFLPAMFVAYVIFVAIVKQTMKNHWMKVISVVILLGVSSIEVLFPALCQLPYGIGRGAIGAAFMLAGFWLKEYPIRYRFVNCFVAAVLYVVALILGSNGSLFVRSLYGPHGAGSVVITWVGGCAGVWLVFGLCRLLEKLPRERGKKFLSFAGQNVMTVFALHMAVKTVFDIFYIKVVRGGNLALMDGYKMGLLPGDAFFYMLLEGVLIIGICLSISRIRIKKS